MVYCCGYAIVYVCFMLHMIQSFSSVVFISIYFAKQKRNSREHQGLRSCSGKTKNISSGTKKEKKNHRWTNNICIDSVLTTRQRRRRWMGYKRRRKKKSNTKNVYIYIRTWRSRIVLLKTMIITTQQWQRFHRILCAAAANTQKYIRHILIDTLFVFVGWKLEFITCRKHV